MDILQSIYLIVHTEVETFTLCNHVSNDCGWVLNIFFLCIELIGKQSIRWDYSIRNNTFDELPHAEDYVAPTTYRKRHNARCAESSFFRRSVWVTWNNCSQLLVFRYVFYRIGYLFIRMGSNNFEGKWGVVASIGFFFTSNSSKSINLV